MRLAGLLAQGRGAAAHADPSERLEILAQLREALARGLGAHWDELREFVILADKFGSFADVWNGTRLLEDSGPLDARFKALQVSAWFHLFPLAARRRPQTAIALLGPDGRGGLSDTALDGVLSRWLDASIATQQREPGHLNSLQQTLAAASDLASYWWPVSSWAEVAPGFASSFVDGALTVAGDQEGGTNNSTGASAKVFANALLIRDRLSLRDEALEDVPLTAPPREEVAEQAAAHQSADSVAALVGRLSESKRRIWVVGALQAKWEHLLGIGKSYGLAPKMFKHVGYDKLRTRSLIRMLDPLKDVGILLGPIPHSVSDLGDHTSLVTMLRRETGILVIELRAQSTSQELKISKSSFRSGLDRLLADAVVGGALT